MKLCAGALRTWVGLIVLTLAASTLGIPGANAQSKLQRSNHQDSSKYDAWLNRQVNRQLNQVSWYGVFDILGYQIRGTTVTLTGDVVNPSMKSEAQNRVKGIEGVTGVINNIKVLPLSTMDNQIRRAEYRAIFSDPSLGRYSMGAIPPLHIIVDNGHVTLVGVVGSNMDKNIAGIRAKSVPGVFSVENDLQVGG